MTSQMVIIFIFFILPGFLTVFDFIYFLFKHKRILGPNSNHVVEMMVMILVPGFFLLVIDEPTNDCCTESAVFSPDHKLTIYVLIGLCELAFFYSSFKKVVHSPLLEVSCNCLLLLAIVLNILIGFHAEQPLWLIGNVPIGLQFIFQIIKNHKLFVNYSQQENIFFKSPIHQLSYSVLQSKLFIKFPILLILCIPVVTFLIGFLLLFGQKYDSVVRAFTDTYHYGFSQWDYMCDNVQCGGHFLCSVGANGHPSIVKPIRYGIRQGGLIICNRQLLIANAFEECIQEHFPFLHHRIRQQYNRVGDFIHRYYWVFKNKYFSDAIYIIMKPLEWCFLIVLYLLDARPEIRIARQYPISFT